MKIENSNNNKIEQTGIIGDEGMDLRNQAIDHIERAWVNIVGRVFRQTPVSKIEDLEELHHNVELHKAIWYASTEILPHLEVQVIVDARNEIFVSTGSAGYVDFNINPIRAGMKTPVKCWIHTHPFGSAYFSGTDIRTVRIWKPLMKTAYVLGGEDHFGFWFNDAPNELEIWNDGEVVRTQTWGTLGEEE